MGEEEVVYLKVLSKPYTEFLSKILSVTQPAFHAGVQNYLECKQCGIPALVTQVQDRRAPLNGLDRFRRDYRKAHKKGYQLQFSKRDSGYIVVCVCLSIGSNLSFRPADSLPQLPEPGP